MFRWFFTAVRLLGAALVAIGSACSEDPDPPVPTEPDSGLLCEAGTENCACTSSGGCRDGLLCISRRCLGTQGPNEPPVNPPPRPLPPVRDPTPDAGDLTDAGEPPSESDAGVLPAVDASDVRDADALPADASSG